MREIEDSVFLAIYEDFWRISEDFRGHTASKVISDLGFEICGLNVYATTFALAVSVHSFMEKKIMTNYLY